MADVFYNAFKDFNISKLGAPYICMIFYTLASFNVGIVCKMLHKKGKFHYTNLHFHIYLIF